MTKEKYEKPIMEVVDLKDDVILTSCSLDLGNATCGLVGCSPVTGCEKDCSWDGSSSCDYGSCVINVISNNTDSSRNC